MKNLHISTEITVYESPDELPHPDRRLVDSALSACTRAYAPYSNFRVGAALRLANGIVVEGNNQENAAYPSGLCAERVAMFYANSMYPDVAVEAMAIVAMNDEGRLKKPITPCGSCRQVLLESEIRMKQEFHILLVGESDILRINSSAALLPLSFSNGALLTKK